LGFAQRSGAMVARVLRHGNMVNLGGVSMRGLLAGLLIGMLWQAGPVGAEVQRSGKARLGDMPVAWSTLKARTARAEGVVAPLSLILFTFSPMTKGSSVSEAQWAKEAARQGTDVATIKMILGSAVYVTREGNLASCTMGAIEKGLCGKARNLSVADRVQTAKSILEQSGTCRWGGFDEALHRRLAYQNGAADHTLWVVADCR